MTARHHPTVLDDLFQGTLFVHPRGICHVVFPGRPEHTAEPHQDFYPVKGTRNTRTVWIPLGDSDAKLGGIAVVRGSHRLGLLDGKALATGAPLDQRTVWHWNPFTCGDAIMFHSPFRNGGYRVRPQALFRGLPCHGVTVVTHHPLAPATSRSATRT